MSPIDRAERYTATGPERGRRITSARVEHLPPAWPLLQVKLESPGERAGAVDRERVVSTLLAPPGSTIVSLVAPPGYGKTTVLSQWAARERRPVAWLTLDELDNELVILVRDPVAALGRIGPEDLFIGDLTQRRATVSSAPQSRASRRGVSLARTGGIDPR